MIDILHSVGTVSHRITSLGQLKLCLSSCKRIGLLTIVVTVVLASLHMGLYQDFRRQFLNALPLSLLSMWPSIHWHPGDHMHHSIRMAGNPCHVAGKMQHESTITFEEDTKLCIPHAKIAGQHTTTTFTLLAFPLVQWSIPCNCHLCNI